MKHEKLVKLRGPLKERCITVILGPFESKIFSHYNCCWGPLWKQSIPLTHCSCYWSQFESKEGYFAHYSCKGGPEASASLAFHSTHNCI